MKMRKRAPLKIISRLLMGVIIIGGFIFSVDLLNKMNEPCYNGCTSDDSSHIMEKEITDYKLAIFKTEVEEAKILIAEEKERKRLADIEAKKVAELDAKRIAKQKAKAEAEKKEKEKYVAISRGNKAQGNWIVFEATHYSAFCNTGCTGVTALGWNVKNTIYHNGLRVIAVDPSTIPLGSLVEVKTSYGSFKALAGDTGGDINKYRIDILVENDTVANRLGREKVQVRLIK